MSDGAATLMVSWDPDFGAGGTAYIYGHCPSLGRHHPSRDADRGGAPRALAALADAAKKYDWPTVLRILDDNPELINATRPGGTSRYTVLHHAAHGKAPPGTVIELVGRGGWLTARNARNQRPLEVGKVRGATKLTGYLTPRLEREVPRLEQIQHHYQKLIRERAGDLVREHSLRLPELEPLQELVVPKMWFAIPGMYGGFLYWPTEVKGIVASDHDQGTESTYPILAAESWCRVVGGSGQCHVVTPYGYTLVADGIV